MITDVAGVRVGHWTDPVAHTGCTVVLLPAGTVASGEVRGGAPASRELALLEPGRLVDQVDAVTLCGGSAFGLAAADGVMRFCEEQGRGFPTSAGPVPIVPALALFDLTVGDASVRPTAESGHMAATAATGGPIELGPVGAGCGATVGKWRGGRGRPGGLVSATVRPTDGGALVVSALLAVNGVGDVEAEPAGAHGDVVAAPMARPFGNTTIGVIATNARLDKGGCHLVAQSGHDGLARALFPAHTRFDGDGLIVAATGSFDDGDDRDDVDLVRILATIAVERAIRSLG